jgi:hypothetical protein
VSYKIGFDGQMSAELDKLLRSVERGVNGFTMHAQVSDPSAASVPSGSTGCPAGQVCDGGVKGGHDLVVVVVVAAVVGAVAGYVAGKVAASGVKGGHD